VLLRSDGHGYDLRRSIAELTDGRVEVDPGGLYRTLRCLEEDGFVTSAWIDGTAGPQRREYRLTDGGRFLAQDWAAQLRERYLLSGLLADALSEVSGPCSGSIACEVRTGQEGKTK
jgi:DNA-binding PadR family transcriptional regulator